MVQIMDQYGMKLFWYFVGSLILPETNKQVYQPALDTNALYTIPT